MEINERIKFLRTNVVKNEVGKKYSQEEFASKMNLKIGVLKNIEYNLTTPKEHVIKLICKEYNVRENWLLYGEEPIFNDENEEVNILNLLKNKNINPLIIEIIKDYILLSKDKKEEINKYINKLLTPLRIEKAKEKAKETLEELKTEETYKIKLYETPVSAGEGVYLNDIEPFETIVTNNLEADFAVKIKGDSMEPLYHDGEIVYIKAQNTIENDKIGIFEYDGQIYIKKYKNGYLISLNENYPPIKIEDSCHFRICGLVL